MKKVIFSLVISLALVAMTLPVYADTTYVVKAGDSLSKIAAQFGVSVQAIVTANGITNPNLIWVGENLIIPAPGTTPSAPAASVPASGLTIQTTYRVQSGDTLYKISRQFGISLTVLMAANQLTSYIIFVGQTLKIPAPGSTVPTATPTAPAPAPAPVTQSTSTYSASGYMAGGLRQDYFYVETNQIAIGQELWFDFKVSHSGDGPGNFGILSIFSNINLHGWSWTNSNIKWGDSLEWRDHIQVGSAGVYPFWLGVCFADYNDCKINGDLWQRLSDTILVTVGDPSTYTSTGYSSNGVDGNYFYVENIVTHKGDPVWFDFKVTNNSGGDVYYGILSAQVQGVKVGQSWTNNRLKAGQVLEWRDHFTDLPAGTFAVFLGICYQSQAACGDGSLWQRLSSNVTITVLDTSQ
jgi:LysM repeat protein